MTPFTREQFTPRSTEQRPRLLDLFCGAGGAAMGPPAFTRHIGEQLMASLTRSIR